MPRKGPQPDDPMTPEEQADYDNQNLRHDASFFIKDGEDPAEFRALGKRMADTDHEAPSSEDEARRKLINCIDQWDSEMDYDAEDRASLADDILHAFNGPPVVSHEAPAEGAGEREEIARTLWISRGGIDRLFDEGAEWKNGNGFEQRQQCFVDADAILALRARWSAPEAREGEAVGHAASNPDKVF